MEVIHDVPAMLTLSERLLLYALIFALRPMRVLEIGTLHGGSAKIIAQALDDLAQGVLVSVDKDPSLQIDWETIAHRAILLKGVSPDCLQKARELAGGPFDLCFIDAEHTYGKVQADAMGALPHMAHDSYLSRRSLPASP